MASGGGDSAADIYAYFTDSNRPEPLKADISGIPTLAQLNARTLPTSDYFNPNSDTVTAGNMRGTDGALTSFVGLPAVIVGGYTSGQSPNDLLDLSTIQSNIGLILSHTRPMAKQLGLVPGVTATHSETAIIVSDGDGSTVITDNGSGFYTVATA